MLQCDTSRGRITLEKINKFFSNRLSFNSKSEIWWKTNISMTFPECSHETSVCPFLKTDFFAHLPLCLPFNLSQVSCCHANIFSKPGDRKWLRPNSTHEHTETNKHTPVRLWATVKGNTHTHQFTHRHQRAHTHIKCIFHRLINVDQKQLKK